MVDGIINVPDAPGIGYEVNRRMGRPIYSLLKDLSGMKQRDGSRPLKKSTFEKKKVITYYM
jgi:hypothetical protein